MEQENYISFIVFHNLLPYPISPTGPSSNIILLHLGLPLFMLDFENLFHTILSSDTYKIILKKILSFSFIWQSNHLCVLFDNPPSIWSPKSDPFSSHFSSKPANFPRQTQRQKLLLFIQRAIVLEPAINPLKILFLSKKKKIWKFSYCCPILASPLLQSDIKREKAAENLPPQFQWHCHTIFRDSLMSQLGGRFRLLPQKI